MPLTLGHCSIESERDTRVFWLMLELLDLFLNAWTNAGAIELTVEHFYETLKRSMGNKLSMMNVFSNLVKTVEHKHLG